MDHESLMADTVYAAWPEHRQEAHRALCLAAYHYAGVAYEPGPIMDTLCAEVLGDQGHDIGARAREDLARAVLRLPLPDLDAPQRPSVMPPSWTGPGAGPAALASLYRAAQARDEARMADALRARLDGPNAGRASVRVSGQAAADMGVPDGYVLGHAPLPDTVFDAGLPR